MIHAPIHVHDVVGTEVGKYSDIWEFSDYRKHSPGLTNVARFMQLLEPKQGASLIDIGCGQGVAGIELAKLGLDVSYLDLVDVLSPETDRGRFMRQPLWEEFGGQWDYGFCCDVMEHMPTEFVMLALHRILTHCRTAYFHVSFREDAMGTLIRRPLHLTVEPFTWWRDRMAAVGDLVDARDLCGDGLFIVRQR